MNLQELKTFTTVAKLKNFTLASRELGLSQPAISRQISSLEDKLEIQLFIRNPRNVLLTKKGEQLYRKAVDFERWMDFEFMDKTQSTLKIGCIEGFLHFWVLPKISEDFLDFWNYFEIKLDRTSVMLNKLEKGELDACFTGRNIQTELISSRVVYNEQYVLISRKDDINEKSLDQYTWIIYGESDPLILSKKKFNPKKMIQINSLQGISSIITRIDAIAAVPYFLAKDLTGIKIYRPKFLEESKIYLNILNHKKLPTHLKKLLNIIE